jgi:hypothetical protein
MRVRTLCEAKCEDVGKSLRKGREGKGREGKGRERLIRQTSMTAAKGKDEVVLALN